jgi:Gas vesicle synthesis protein GvpL/GvpF
MATKENGAKRAVYVYGIVPADTETTAEAHGVGDPPAEVGLVHHGGLAALVSSIDPDEPLGRPEDLMAHEALLDQASAEVPVLPLRFGAVVTDEDAVTEELLAAHHDEFVAALHELEGRAQFVVKGRYRMDVLLPEILDEDEELAGLRDAIRGKPEDATHAERVAIGERVADAVAASRDADTRTVVEALTELGATVNVREPTHDEDAVHVACLVDLAKQDDLESALDELAQKWGDRVAVRLLGPLAPYDFVIAKSGT